MQVVGFVNALDGDGSLVASGIGVGHGGAKKHLVFAVVQRRVGHLGNVQALGQKADAPINFAQALFAIQVVAIFRAVAILGGPGHDFNDLRALVIEQAHQLGAQALVTRRGQVVAGAGGQRRQTRHAVFVVWPWVIRSVAFFGECFAHVEL